MTLVSEKQGNYLAIVELLEARLSSLFIVSGADPVPEGQVAEALTYFPYNFGSRFPVSGVSELTHEGEVERAGHIAPGYIDIGVRVYYPSLVGQLLGEVEDGRQEARRVTRRVYSAWRAALYADLELWNLAERVTLGRAESGDHDQVGNPFSIPNRQDTALWVTAAAVRFYL